MRNERYGLSSTVPSDSARNPMEELEEQLQISDLEYTEDWDQELADDLDNPLSEAMFSAVMEQWKEIGISPVEVRKMRFDPVMTDPALMQEAAYDAADIIERHNRVPLEFEKLLEESGRASFQPDCRREELLIDTGSFTRQVGAMTVGMLTEVVETKKHCAECPFARECLAVSMTAPRNGRPSKNERILPNGNSRVPLVLDEYLIFGGFTPQERRIIFDMICNILEEKDSWSEG